MQFAYRTPVFELLGPPLDEDLFSAALAKDMRALGALNISLAKVSAAMAARSMPVFGAGKASFHEKCVLG